MPDKNSIITATDRPRYLQPGKQILKMLKNAILRSIMKIALVIFAKQAGKALSRVLITGYNDKHEP